MDRWRSLTSARKILLGLLLVVLGLLGLGFTGEILRARWRGTTAGFPPPIPWSGEPRVGLNVSLFGQDPAIRQRDLTQIRALGISRIRAFFPWSQIEPERGRLDWTEADAVMADVQAAGLELVAVLGDSPPWAARRAGPMAPPLNPADFARFAGAFASRYGQRMQFYQIWDEPNLTIGWGGGFPDPETYWVLLREAAAAIRQADPDAVIVLAGLAPTVEQGPWNLADWLFLERLYRLCAREGREATGEGRVAPCPYFDIVAAKPYGFDTGPEDRRVDPEVLNFSRAVLLREVMVRYGDEGKPVWASHWGWNALPPGWTGRPSIWGQVDEATQARYVQEAIERVRREWPWMGTMFLESWRPDAPPDDPRWGFALVDPTGRWRPAAEALRAAARSAPFTPGYYPAAIPQGSSDGSVYGPPPGAVYEGAWRFSALGADIGQEEGDRLSFIFEGTGLALRVRRGGYRAHLYLWVDGQPANRLPRDERGAYLILTSPDYVTSEVVTVPVAEGLPYGKHIVRIEAERGWGQWALVGWSIAGVQPAIPWYRGALILSLLGMGLGGWLILVGLFQSRRALWETLQGIGAAMVDRLGWWGAWGLSGVVYLGMWWAALESWGNRRWGEVGWLGLGLAVSGVFYLAPRIAFIALTALLLLGLLMARPTLGLALTAFWAPFYLYPKPFFEKAFSMAELSILMTAAAWILRRAILQRKNLWAGWEWEEADRWMLIFFGAATLSAALAAFPRVAWREWRMVILEPLLFYALARAMRPTRAEWGTVLLAFLLGGLGAAGVGLAQWITGTGLITGEAGARCIRGPYGSPNNLALYLGRVLPFLLAFSMGPAGAWSPHRAGSSPSEIRGEEPPFLRKPGGVQQKPDPPPLGSASPGTRILAGIALILAGLALVGTCSEGAWFLGIPAALTVMGGLWLRDHWGGLPRWARWGMGVLMLVGVLIVAPIIAPRLGEALTQRAATPGSTVFFRIRLWASTMDLIREHPLFGVGPDNFLYWFRSRYIRPDAWQEPNLSHPHNVFLDFWARTGLLGLIAWIAWQILFWRRVGRRGASQDPWRWGAAGAMGDTLGHGLVDNGFFLVDLSMAFMVIFLTGAFDPGSRESNSPGEDGALPS
ncbi:O-antigen ligase family protein [Thermoflexus sp.]|uniref:O-antigen ligase family protein n=1 Tax=Thermoflexus sp. TaxID=1969742 RepID=UPI00260FFF3A|nr:O-antigen ligase family protein [Thermoflexus sp.]MCX7691057.1 O-antigen ligase family protein [Thermoflexus sp.]